MSQEQVSKPLLTFPLSNMKEFCDAVWNGDLNLESEGVIFTFTSETDFTFTYPDGQLIYQGHVADLRFMARILFEDTIYVSPFDQIDEREEQKESGDLEDLEDLEETGSQDIV